MSGPPSCPSCGTPLGLFTPREITSHVNACLDAKAPSPTSTSAPPPTCGVCNRDLSALTTAARLEHANRCADSTLPLDVRPHPTRRRPRQPVNPAMPVPRTPARPDAAVFKLLELLGLSRYAARFADQEVDFDALLLLDDSDYAQLRIPDAARRRIADALHNVPLLAQLRHSDDDDPNNALTQTQQTPVPTQRFGTSNLEKRLQRRRGLLDDGSSEDEFPLVPKEVPISSLDGAGERKESREPSGLVRSSLVKGDDSGGNRDGVLQKEQTSEQETRFPVSGHQEKTLERKVYVSSQSASEDESEAVSSLRNFEENMPATSQISLEVKLEKWLQREMRKENERHEKAVKSIELKYEHMKGKLGQRNPVNSNQPTTAKEKVADTILSSPIDLTRNVSLRQIEKRNPKQPVVSFQENESILISSSRSPSNQACNSHASDEEPLLIPEPLTSPTNANMRPVPETLSETRNGQADSDSEIMDLTLASAEQRRQLRIRDSNSICAEGHNFGQTCHSDTSVEEALPIPESFAPPTKSSTRPCPDTLSETKSVKADSESEVMDLTRPPAEKLGESDERVGDSSGEHPVACFTQRRAVPCMFESEDEETGEVDVSKESVPLSERRYPITAGSRDENSIVPPCRTSNNAETVDVEPEVGVSRLKKRRRKVTRAEIIEGIKLNSGLYDDMLAMELVSFERIAVSVKEAGLVVSKKALGDFLHAEGVTFNAKE